MVPVAWIQVVAVLRHRGGHDLLDHDDGLEDGLGRQALGREPLGEQLHCPIAEPFQVHGADRRQDVVGQAGPVGHHGRLLDRVAVPRGAARQEDFRLCLKIHAPILTATIIPVALTQYKTRFQSP